MDIAFRLIKKFLWYGVQKRQIWGSVESMLSAFSSFF